MRTTLAIDDDVLEAAKEIARTERRTIGEVVSALARRALQPENPTSKVRNGIPLLTIQPNARRVTSELVKQLGEELP